MSKNRLSIDLRFHVFLGHTTNIGAGLVPLFPIVDMAFVADRDTGIPPTSEIPGQCGGVGEQQDGKQRRTK